MEEQGSSYHQMLRQESLTVYKPLPPQYKHQQAVVANLVVADDPLGGEVTNEIIITADDNPLNVTQDAHSLRHSQMKLESVGGCSNPMHSSESFCVPVQGKEGIDSIENQFVFIHKSGNIVSQEQLSQQVLTIQQPPVTSSIQTGAQIHHTNDTENSSNTTQSSQSPSLGNTGSSSNNLWGLGLLTNPSTVTTTVEQLNNGPCTCFICGRGLQDPSERYNYLKTQKLFNTQSSLLELLSEVLSQMVVTNTTAVDLCVRCSELINDVDLSFMHLGRLKKQINDLFSNNKRPKLVFQVLPKNQGLPVCRGSSSTGGLLPAAPPPPPALNLDDLAATRSRRGRQSRPPRPRPPPGPLSGSANARVTQPKKKGGRPRKPFACHICKRKFLIKEMVSSHMVREHGVQPIALATPILQEVQQHTDQGVRENRIVGEAQGTGVVGQGVDSGDTSQTTEATQTPLPEVVTKGFTRSKEGQRSGGEYLDPQQQCLSQSLTDQTGQVTGKMQNQRSSVCMNLTQNQSVLADVNEFEANREAENVLNNGVSALQGLDKGGQAGLEDPEGKDCTMSPVQDNTEKDRFVAKANLLFTAQEKISLDDRQTACLKSQVSCCSMDSIQTQSTVKKETEETNSQPLFGQRDMKNEGPLQQGCRLLCPKNHTLQRVSRLEPRDTSQILSSLRPIQPKPQTVMQTAPDGSLLLLVNPTLQDSPPSVIKVSPGYINLRSGLHVCGKCHKTFQDERSRRMHRIAAHGMRKRKREEEDEDEDEEGCRVGDETNRFTCKTCHASFSSKKTLVEHRRTLHTHPASSQAQQPGLAQEGSRRTTYCCDQCHQSFSYKYELERHRESHVPYTQMGPHEFVCCVCGLKVASKAALKIHLHRFHNKEEESKDYLCSQCGYMAATKKAFTDHQRVHSTDPGPKAKCKICHKEMLASSYKIHTLRMHGEPKYPCQNCGQKFTVRSDLMRHLNTIHSTLRPYDCELCGEKFATSDALRYHRNKTHSTVLHHCDHCEKAYKWRGELRSHIQRNHTAHKEKVSCRVCGRAYLDRRKLKHHLLAKHNLPRDTALLYRASEDTDTTTAPEEESPTYQQPVEEKSPLAGQGGAPLRRLFHQEQQQIVCAMQIPTSNNNNTSHSADLQVTQLTIHANSSQVQANSSLTIHSSHPQLQTDQPDNPAMLHTGHQPIQAKLPLACTNKALVHSGQQVATLSELQTHSTTDSQVHMHTSSPVISTEPEVTQQPSTTVVIHNSTQMSAAHMQANHAMDCGTMQLQNMTPHLQQQSLSDMYIVPDLGVTLHEEQVTTSSSHQ